VPSNPAPAADSLDYFDRLGVHNQYYAPQIGLSAGASYYGFFAEATGKVGLGLLHASATIEGQTTQRSGGVVSTSSGGVLAPLTGSGAAENRFVVLPELTLTGGYQLASWCRLTVGYNLLFASQVVRASSLVGAVDARQVPQLPSFDPTVSASALHLQNSSLWVQGVSGGLEFRY
jgi:hypothetical protein